MKVKYIADPRIGGCYLIADANVAEITNLLLQGKYTETQALLEKNKAVKSELDSVLFQDVYLIVPSAVQDVITKDNAVKVKAKYLVEGANGPTTKEAYEILQSNKVKIIPDFIANPGGVIAAYIELVSDVTVEENIRTRKKVEDAKKYTIEKITENVHNLLSTVQEYKVDNVTAAKYLALSNLYHA